MTSRRLALIVEGHAEQRGCAASLAHRCVDHLGLAPPIVLRPVRLRRNKVREPAELGRALRLCADRAGPDGAVLILIDADDDCPAELGPCLVSLASELEGHVTTAVVVAKRMFESWLIAGAGSLGGVARLSAELDPPLDPESVPSPKKWLSERMIGRFRYDPAADMLDLTRAFDVGGARSSCPSFDKFCRELSRLLPASAGRSAS